MVSRRRTDTRQQVFPLETERKGHGACRRQLHDIPYKESEEAYVKERCKLDIYYPEDTTGCPVVVWFHGGGLTQGNKSFPWKLKEKGMVLVAVNSLSLGN